MREKIGDFGCADEGHDEHSRELTNPGVWVMGVYRFGKWKNTINNAALRWIAHKAYRVGFLGTNVFVGCHIPDGVEFGDRPHLIHAKDIMLHSKVKIGDRVGMMQGVAIATTPDRPGVPEIGNDVLIGIGAVLIGPIKIGDGARIAPNSLVMRDVPAGATALGVPARIIRGPEP